jgi:hypothetical protein
MSGSPMSRPEFLKLDEVAEQLLARLNVEEARPASGASTVLVGGIVKACSKLESFLRELVNVVAGLEGCKVDELTSGPQRSGGPGRRLPMTGALAHGMKAYFQRSQNVDPVLRSLARDLRSTNSAILGFIDVRNRVAKADGDPAAIRPATVRLRTLIQAFRQDATLS